MLEKTGRVSGEGDSPFPTKAHSHTGFILSKHSKRDLNKTDEMHRPCTRVILTKWLHIFKLPRSSFLLMLKGWESGWRHKTAYTKREIPLLLKNPRIIYQSLINTAWAASLAKLSLISIAILFKETQCHLLWWFLRLTAFFLHNY